MAEVGGRLRQHRESLQQRIALAKQNLDTQRAALEHHAPALGCGARAGARRERASWRKWRPRASTIPAPRERQPRNDGKRSGLIGSRLMALATELDRWVPIPMPPAHVARSASELFLLRPDVRARSGSSAQTAESAWSTPRICSRSSSSAARLDLRASAPPTSSRGPSRALSIGPASPGLSSRGGRIRATSICKTPRIKSSPRRITGRCCRRSKDGRTPSVSFLARAGPSVAELEEAVRANNPRPPIWHE